jgi:hypothetical protein
MLISQSARFLFLALALASVPIATSTATAALLGYDPFSQSTGAIDQTASPEPPGVWPNAGANWVQQAGITNVVSGSLAAPAGTYYPFTPVGNSAQLLNAGSQVTAARAFTVFDYNTSGNSYWFSFLMQPSENDLANQGLNLIFSSASQIYFGTDGAGDYVIRAFGNSSAGGGNEFANTNVRAVANTTALLVVNIDSNTAFNIWVNPTGFSGGQPTGGTFAQLTANINTFKFDGISLGGNTTSGKSTIFDEFRFGTTAAAVVPEPSTYAMLLAGLGCCTAGIARRRWRVAAPQ